MVSKSATSTGSLKAPPAASGGVAGGEKKRRKRRRDRDKPKRAMSAYLVFLSRHRLAVQKSHPNWSVTDVTKELARRWKTVADKERAECQQQSEEDKKRYYDAMAEYVPLPDIKEEEAPIRYDKDGNRKRRKKDKNAPRKNRSAYIIWAAEYREKNFRPKAATPNAVSFRDQAAELGQAWAMLSASAKKKYDDAAAKEAKEYAAKRDAYLAEKKHMLLALREAKRERLLEEKRAWEATKAAAQKAKEERKLDKAAQKDQRVKERSTAKKAGAFPKTGKKGRANEVTSSDTMARIKASIERVSHESAWYKVVDKHSKAPEKVNDAYKQFIKNAKEAHFTPDPKAFLVAVLGYDEAEQFLIHD